MVSSLGLVVNPFSGRDVRRVAARASTSDHHEKQQQVTRLVLSALSMGVEKIFLGREPFRINEKAVENLPQRDQIEILQYPLTHRSEDSETMTRMMWDRGARTFIVLGGDGTSRIVSRRFTEATILPLSTGTNNVFPYRLEASVAGLAAGLIATGKIDSSECQRCKRILVSKTEADGTVTEDIALIDAVLLRNDHLGNLLPFEADNLRTLILTRAEPASIGISPIGGYLMPTGFHDDWGVQVECSPDANRRLEAPLSPGLHKAIGIADCQKLALDHSVTVQGPGILAFDGDRLIKLREQESAVLTVKRDGPRIIETDHVLKLAAERNLFESIYNST